MLEPADIERLREIFMPRAECSTQMTGVNLEIADLKQQLLLSARGLDWCWVSSARSARLSSQCL